MTSSSNKPVKIAISVGELSGDEHAAHLVKALRQSLPDLELRGMGGRNMRSEGVNTIVDSEKSASVMGFSEVVGSLKKILSAFKDMKFMLQEWRPDLLIVIDYPDFNMRLAKKAKDLGIPVLYFIAPKVWAWRKRRVKILKKICTHIAVIFPFEEKFMRENGLTNVSFVGNPLTSNIDTSPVSPQDKKQFLESLTLSTDKKTIAIFPGSRLPEIKKHLEISWKGFEILSQKYQNLQAIINVAPSIDENLVQSFVPVNLPLKVTKADPILVLKIADYGLLKSGTSNLQAAICGLPFVMFYIASKLSAFIAKKFVTIREYSLVNILKSGTVTELIQEDANPEKFAENLEKLITDQNLQDKMKRDFADIRLMLQTSRDMNSSYTENVKYIVLKILQKAQ